MPKQILPCPPGQIRNPKTRRCVKETGSIGKKLVPCPSGQVRNPKTGRCIKDKNDVNAIQSNGHTLLTQAINDHNLENFEKLLATPGIDVNTYNNRPELCNPLLEALRVYSGERLLGNNDEICRKMIIQLLSIPWIDVNGKTFRNDTPLFMAIYAGDEVIFDKLLKFPNLNISWVDSNSDNTNAVSIAVRNLMWGGGSNYFLKQILADKRFDPSEGQNPIPLVLSIHESQVSDAMELLQEDGIEYLYEKIDNDAKKILNMLLAYKPEWAVGIDLSHFGIKYKNISKAAKKRTHTARNTATVAWMRAHGLPKVKKTRKNM